MPDQYLPVWYLISNPIFILVLLGVALLFIKELIKNRIFFLFSSTFILNLVLYFVLNPVIYNGIRHFLFLYPMGSMIALLGFIELYKWVRQNSFKGKKILITLSSILLTINILFVVLNYIKLYPYGYIYFNELVGGLNGANSKYETDYWAASTKEAIEWLNVNTPDDLPISVSSLSFPNQITYYMKSNMTYYKNSEREKARYYIFGDIRQLEGLNGKIIHTIQRDGVDLIYIFEFQK